jgi:hypothetical protein
VAHRSGDGQRHAEREQEQEELPEWNSTSPNTNSRRCSVSPKSRRRSSPNRRVAAYDAHVERSSVRRSSISPHSVSRSNSYKDRRSPTLDSAVSGAPPTSGATPSPQRLAHAYMQQTDSSKRRQLQHSPQRQSPQQQQQRQSGSGRARNAGQRGQTRTQPLDQSGSSTRDSRHTGGQSSGTSVLEVSRIEVGQL